MHKTPYMWLINIDVIFECGMTGSLESDHAEIRSFATLDNIATVCNSEIEKSMDEGDKSKYVRTDFTVECIGFHEIIEIDSGIVTH